MPDNRQAKFVIDGRTYEYATFIDGIGHEPADTHLVLGSPDAGRHHAPHDQPAVEPDRNRWSVELPIVLWMLDQVECGNLAPAGMRELLVDATAPRSDRCSLCDGVWEPEDQLLARLSHERHK